MLRQATCIRVLIVVAAISSLAQAANKPAQRQMQLQLTAKPDRLVYRMSDTIKVQTQLLNTGIGDVYVWGSDLCWNMARGLSIYLVRSDGSPARGKVLFDCLPPPPSNGEAEGFLKLRAGASHATSDDFTASDLVDKPGEYDLQITFTSFLSRKWIRQFYPSKPIAKLPIWTLEEPKLTSPRVHLTIKP